MVLLALGFSAAQLRTSILSTPQIHTPLENVLVRGKIVHIEKMIEKVRITLDLCIFDQSTTVNMDIKPKKIRITERNLGQLPKNLRPGDVVRVKATLLSPSEPVIPGGYNFRAHAFFQGLGAIGYTVGPIQVVSRNNSNLWDYVNQFRQFLTDEIRVHIKGSAGGISAALITGDRSGISEQVKQEFIDSGITHILSISGLHMAFVAGIIFFIIRSLLVVVPAIALRIHTKKWAAFLSIIGTAGYTIVSGADVPVIRSFLMTSIIMISILYDRNAISMRLVAFAAFILLLLTPEVLLSPSFQLSFAAVIGLVAFYESVALKFSPIYGLVLHLLSKFIYVVFGILCSTLIATLATLPFTIALFNRFTLHAVVANILAVPLTGIWVMPCAVVSLLVMPLGLHPFFLKLMGVGVEYMMMIASIVAHWPGASILLSQMSLFTETLIIVGGLWLCLWQQKWRWLGMVPIIIAILFLPTLRKPDVFVSLSPPLVGVMDHESNTLLLSGFRSKGFVNDLWRQHSGVKVSALMRDSDLFECSYNVCRGETSNGLINIYFKRKGVSKACKENGVLVSFDPLVKECLQPKVVLDRAFLKEKGNTIIYFDKQNFHVKSVKDWVGHRPWSQN